MRMLVEERRQNIIKLIDAQGRATVKELSDRFGISAVTIRNDLEVLARTGVIMRSHGGALPAAIARVDTPLPVKETRHLAEKRHIGEAAARLINDGETIILDAGSTTVEIARRIRQRNWQSLTVITNALNVAMELADVAGVRVMMLGGLLRPTSYSLAGPAAKENLSRLIADRLFLGVDGLDLQSGISTPDPEEAALNALMVQVSREVVAVMDASKLGQRSLSLIATIDDLDFVITDVTLPHTAVEALRKSGVKVLLV